MTLLNIFVIFASSIQAACIELIFRLRFLYSLARPIPPQWTSLHAGKASVFFKDKIKFSEDVVLDHERGFAIISADAGRAQWNTVMGPLINPDPKGQLYLYDYATSGSLRPVELVNYPRKADFHPLGVNIFRGASNGRTRLFVVNHRRSVSTVEIMDIDYTEARATHVLTVADGDINIRTPNAVAPISYTQFYVTNDHYYPLKSSPRMSHLETWLSLRKGWVTLVNFSNPEIIDCKAVAKGIAFANGITLTPTGKQLLVASTTTNCVHIYDRDPTNNAISSNCEIVHVSFPPDNLRFDFSLSVDDPTAFDQDGRFLRGATASGCPNPLKLVGMSKNPAAVKAPSMIVELCRGSNSNTASYVANLSGPETKYCARMRYQSSGQHFPCATTGAVDLSRGRLIGSGLYAEGILDISFEPK